MIRLIAQSLLNGLSRRRRFGARELLIRLGYKTARKVLSAIDDPLVTYRLLGHDLTIPLSHDLPIIRALYQEYGLQLGRITRCVLEKYPSMVALDIGANVGDSVAIFRSAGQFPILCVEPDERYAELLEENTTTDPDVTVARAMLDAVSSTARGVLVADRGTARLNRIANGNVLETISLADLLGQFPSFTRPKLIKIDTDGMDARILSGAAGLLAEAEPVLFFEYDPHLALLSGARARELLAELAQIGYRMALVYENDGDFVSSLDLRDTDRLDDLHDYYSGRRGKRYADICAFHESDLDLWSIVRDREREHYRRARRFGDLHASVA